MTHLTTLFVSGTDTDAGKTYVASLIARALHAAGRRVGVYKPVASGCRDVDGQRIADDAVCLWDAAGRPRTLEEVCPQRFSLAVSPPAAAAAEGRQIDIDLLRRGADRWIDGFEVRIIEGAGGLLSPLAEGLLNIDFLLQFDSPRLLIVAPNRLGVIHQVLATCESARHRGVTPAGVILSQTTPLEDPSVPTNLRELQRYGEVPVLGSVKFQAESWPDLSPILAWL